MRIFCRALPIVAAIAIICTVLPCRGADYVIHISVDGLRPDYMQAVIAAGQAPNFKRFQDEGAWTNNARADYTHTITLPNHASMITGRPVSQPAGLPTQTEHGLTDNFTPLPTTTLHNNTTPYWYKTSVFDVVHDAGFTTALFASKNKFIIFEQSYNEANGAPNANGQDKITTYYGSDESSDMQSQLLTSLAADHFKYTFVHYADPDNGGHAYGWGSNNYLAEVKKVDGYLGQVFNLVQNDATLAGRTTIILNADHGGDGFSHDDPTLAVDYTIPFFAWGAGVGRGDLYSLNIDTRTDPGTSRPSFTDVGQPIRNGDGGNLALSLLGLGPIPGSLINVAQNLRVAAPGDFNFDGYVDANDYVVWRMKYGDPYTPSDYSAWQAQFGWTPVGGSGTGGGLNVGPAVPEPTAVCSVLIAASGLAVLGNRRSGRRSPG